MIRPNEISAVDHNLARKSVMASFVTGAIFNAQAHYFVDDLQYAIDAALTGTRRPSGKPLSKAQLDAVASSDVINQLWNKSAANEQLILSPELPQALDIYLTAQTVIDKVELTLVKNELHVPTVLSTVRRINGKAVPTSPAIEVVVRTWSARGVVPQEVENRADVQNASERRDASSIAPDFYDERGTIQAEGHKHDDLNVPYHSMEVPYYAQFHEVEHGKIWLSSLLEDLISMDVSIRDLPN